MNGKYYKFWLLATMLMLLLANVLRSYPQPRQEVSPQPKNPAAPEAAISEATRNKVLTYLRERFGIPESIKLTLGALHASTVAPSFNDAEVTVDDGKAQRKQAVLISKDSRFLVVVMGSIIELHQNSESEMVERIREVFKTPATIKLSVGGFKHSLSPDFEQGTLTLDDGKTPKQDRVVLLARDGKHLILSEIYNLAIDPREQALRTISVRDEPSQGPADAPVTIVEYADLECPTCARVHEFLETILVPRYGDKVRVVFKEYPLPMHDWSLTAAIACQCAYEINPSTFLPLRTAIFRNQQLINITNVRETVLAYGEQAGLDRVKLAGCVDAKASYPRIQRDVAEAKRVNVDRTPTLFINGKMVIGLPSDQEYFQIIDGILRGGK